MHHLRTYRQPKLPLLDLIIVTISPDDSSAAGAMQRDRGGPGSSPRSRLSRYC